MDKQSIKIETTGGNVFAYTLDEIEKIAKELRFSQEIRHQGKVSTPGTGLKKGYRGIVELGTVLPFGIRLDIINGYQFNPYFSLGFGTGLHAYFDEGLLMPFFVDLRINYMDRKISPYTSLGIGYSFNLTDYFEPSGVYFSPTCGVRFKLNEKCAMNVGLGLGIQGFSYYHYYYDYYYGGYGGRSSYISAVLNLNVGVSF